jgi:trimethylamine--corrinoid protein Co-methyltransferase
MRDFLGTEHTLKHFRAEQFLPILLDRDKFDVWQEAGGQRVEERARDRVADLLRAHEPEPLPDEAMRELRSIYAAYAPPN